jgi:hypothetical protein
MKRSNHNKSTRTDRLTLPELDQTKRSVLNLSQSQFIPKPITIASNIPKPKDRNGLPHIADFLPRNSLVT